MSEVTIVLLPIVTAMLSAWLAYYFAVRARLSESSVRFKEEKYARLLLKLQGFVGVTKSGALKREFFEEEYQSWLYASDEVVTALNELVRLVKDSKGQAPDLDAGHRAVGNVVLAMRRDLLSKTRLDYRSFQYTDVVE